MERAHRLLPNDKLVALTLGWQRLARGDPTGAVALLTSLAHFDRVPSAWMALASAHLALNAVDLAAEAVEQVLRQAVVTAEAAALADKVVALTDRRGWCGLSGNGRLQTGPGEPISLLLDGRPVAPSDPLDGDSLVVIGSDGPFLGSPLPLHRLRALEGFVAEADGGLTGWAWHPGMPERPPTLTIRGPRGVHTMSADAPADGVEDLPPLARPRRFRMSAAALASLGSPVTVTDGRGKHLLGSPIWHGETPERTLTGAPRVDVQHREADIVVPVYGRADETLACLTAVLASVPAETVVHVIDDASPEPECATALAHLAQNGRIRLHRHPENRGFPAAVNTGLRAAAGRDVVVLNSDTLVPRVGSRGCGRRPMQRLRSAPRRPCPMTAASSRIAAPVTRSGSMTSRDGECGTDRRSPSRGRLLPLSPARLPRPGRHPA